MAQTSTTFHFVGCPAGCLYFGIDSRLYFESRFDVVPGTVYYAIMGGIYAWQFYHIIIKSSKKGNESEN